MCRMLVLVLFLSVCVGARTTLSGPIGGMTLDSTGNPYLITDNLAVPAGKTLKINAGCVLLFKPFTGVVVEGSIEVMGSPESPAVFTSENDSRYNFQSNQAASPFDWNGIHVTRDADEAWFCNTLIAFSVYGLKSESRTIGMENAVFYQNGQFHFTIRDSIFKVQDGFPFSYNARSAGVAAKEETGFFGKSVPIIVGGAGVGFGVFSGVSAGAWFRAKADYEDETELGRQKTLKDKGRAELAKAVVFGSLAAVALPSALVIHLRNKKQAEQQANMAVTPVVSSRARGVLVSLRF